MRGYITLDDRGHLVPEDEAGQRWLAGRSGRWRIVESAGDLLLLRREPANGEADGKRAILSGDLKGLGLGELLGFLAQSRWTGVVKVVSDKIERAIFVKHGSVKWASSNQPSDRLGSVLQRLGLVTAEDVKRAMAAPEGNRKIGQALLGMGLIDSTDLYSAIKHNVEEIFFSSLLVERGLFFLFNDPLENRFAVNINLDLNGLLMDGLRRIDEIGHFKKRIPGPHCYVNRLKTDVSGLTDSEIRALEAITGQSTVNEIAAQMHLGEFETTKILFGLAEAGYIEVTEEAPSTAIGSAGQHLTAEVHEVARVFNSIFREIITELSEVAPTTGYRLGANSFLSSEKHDYPDLLSGLSVDEEGKLPEDILVARATAAPAERTSDPARYLCNALNQLLSFKLFQAGEILAPDREETLSRRVETIYQFLEK